MTPASGIHTLERFFRVAASLDIDKEDVRRFWDFLAQKTYDLLLRGQAIAKANGREIIEPFDLPITKGLQENIHQFRALKQEVDIKPLLERRATLPWMELTYSQETEAQFPEIVGGVSLALARTFKIIDPKLKNPQTADWENAFKIFNLLL
jgi:hypothetical protein